MTDNTPPDNAEDRDDEQHENDDIGSELHDMLGGLTRRIEQENDEQYGETAAHIMELYEHKPTPESFYRWTRERNIGAEQSKNIAAALVRRMDLPEKITEVAFRELYQNYDRYKRMITSNMQDLEGLACSVDKTRVLLNRIYPAWLLQQEHRYREGAWNAPYPNTHEAWSELIFSYMYFDGGKYQKFVTALMHLQIAYSNDTAEADGISGS